MQPITPGTTAAHVQSLATLPTLTMLCSYFCASFHFYSPPPAFGISPLILHAPGAFPFFNLAVLFIP